MEPREGDDERYEELVRGVLEDSPAEHLEDHEMVRRGAGALPLDLLFIDVFAGGRDGFDALLGNPPWDKQIPLERELYGRFDATVIAAPTARERAPLYAKLRERKDVREAWQAYEAPFRRLQNAVKAMYSWQSVRVEHTGPDEKPTKLRTSGHADAYRFFFERSWRCLSSDGRLGMVLPQSFYANEGATGIRRLALIESHLELCLAFVNRRKIFDIGAGQRFALVVVRKGTPGGTIRAAFGLEGLADLEGRGGRDRIFDLDIELIRKVSPAHLCLPELVTRQDLEASRTLFSGQGGSYGVLADLHGLALYQERNMTNDSPGFSSTTKVLGSLQLQGEDPRREPVRSDLARRGWLVVHEKGTFHSYDDLVKDQPRYLVSRSSLISAREGRQRARPRDRHALICSDHFRLAVRATVHATERKKAVFCLLPPGVVVGNSALVERRPMDRPLALALATLAVGNSTCFDFAAKLRMATNLNQFILRSLPWPKLDESAEAFLAHAALRLSCNHEVYRPLWQRMMGDQWHERGALGVWPAVSENMDRLSLLASIEAVVADGFGLTSKDLRHIVSRSDLGGTDTANTMVDDAYAELNRQGLAAFVRSRDPYSSSPPPGLAADRPRLGWR